MYIKCTLFVLVSLALLQNTDGKKSKKKLNNNDEESTPQPNVVTYSTFGFNNVGSYDGFVPSSPDYANYIANNKQESSTRLYAPAFPSAIDTTGLGSYYDPQPDVGSFSISSDGYQTGVQAYHTGSQNIFTSPSQDKSNDEGKITETKELYNFNTDINSPIYGTKISSKNKNKNFDNYNQTDYNIFSSVSSVLNNGGVFEKNANNNYPNSQSSHSTDDDKYFMLSSPTSSSSLTFPKVVDFTSVKNYYPTSVETNFQESIQKPFILDIHENAPSDTILNSYKSYSKSSQKQEQPQRNKLNYKDEKNEKEISGINYFTSDDVPDLKINFKNIRNKSNNKDKLKNKIRISSNSNEIKKSKNSNGYDYPTNYSSTSLRFDYGSPKKPSNSNIDEIASASNNFDFVDYQLPETEISGFKYKQNAKSPYDIDSQSITYNNYNYDKYKPSDETISSFKNLYSTSPTTSSHWGNIFKTNEFSYKNHLKKPFYKDDNDDIVHIPKRQQDSKYGKYSDNKFSDWSLTTTYDPYKINDGKPQFDWTKDIFNTRFKSEEDLLGLRNHDTSHTSSVPLFKPSNDFDEEYDYKKLVQKWRQNYFKSKYRDSNREYETYASETKPIHVPLPRPYPIEVPRPVIVPVPQPYPVKVPIPKPVAVPVYRELTVSIEKPVPYPVIKKVPYPIVKHVPVPVEKQVRVPVVKPYPVHIPQIRPVFHHTKPYDDRETEMEEEEEIPRPDPKRLNHHYRIKNSRNRPRSPSRRPLRMTYQDRNRRRIPNRRPSLNYHDDRPRRPYSDIRALHRYRDDFEEYDSDSDYENYCKRSGKC